MGRYSRVLVEENQQNAIIPTADFERYAELSLSKKEPNMVVVETILQNFYDSHPKVAPERLEAIVSRVGPVIRTNLGLATLIQDYEAWKSEFFFPWLISTWTSPSLALETAYGDGYDLDGIFRVIPSDDPLAYFAKNDPTFVYNRERELVMAELAIDAREYATPMTRSKIIDLGAGQMAWVRHTGFPLSPMYQHIYAYDRDPRIEPNRIFSSMNGITYEHWDIKSAFEDQRNNEADLVLIGGVASYMPITTFRDKILIKAYHKLKPNGVCFFDMQLDCPYLKRSTSVFGWPGLMLTQDAEEAFRNIELLRKSLAREGLVMSATYQPDTRNEVPSAIMVTMRKL